MSRPRSLAGGDEVQAEIDLPEQGEAKDAGQAQEDAGTQQRRVDEESQSVQGLEDRKVENDRKKGTGLDSYIQ